MTISVFDLYSIGIGPSSSHTVGPMKASHNFSKYISELSKSKQNPVSKVLVELYGSLALTGIGHGTDKAVLLGLEGNLPDSIDPNIIDSRYQEIQETKSLNIYGSNKIEFDSKRCLLFKRRKTLKYHPNALVFRALFENNEEYEETYYSIGGGFIVNDKDIADQSKNKPLKNLPYEFSNGDELLEISVKNKLSISEIMMENEKSLRSENEIYSFLDSIWNTMKECIESGYTKEGFLPGGLKVKRRAKIIHDKLLKENGKSKDPLKILDWVNLYALSVNEENASGCRIVTAPTNGAAGIIPAVLKYYDVYGNNSDQKAIRDFLLTAAAIGILYKKNASISGAEVGCQGEVGVACSMAAAGLVAAFKGSMEQVEQAAEIGMEHNLGLTCDPIGGLVQIPCIERNAMASVKAINAARIALNGDGHHYVSLDSVIKTMAQTGKDMMTKYKETSRGGLAVNVKEC